MSLSALKMFRKWQWIFDFMFMYAKGTGI